MQLNGCKSQQRQVKISKQPLLLLGAKEVKNVFCWFDFRVIQKLFLFEFVANLK